LKTVGILYHPKIASAGALAEELAAYLPTLGASAWLCSAWEEEEAKAQTEGTDLLVSIGGDGTILRAARAALSWSVPIVGVNLGRLGFMTELGPAEAREGLARYLADEGWVDERAMLEVQLAGKEPLYALNDVFVGRGAIPRVVDIDVTIDGALLATYRTDGMIVATATGSTGYSLAAGGPILYPQSKDMVLQCVCPHLAFSNALVLASTTVVDLKLHTTHQAMLSIDGQVNHELKDGDSVRVRTGAHVTRFLRSQPPTHFYDTLMNRLVRK